MLSSIHPLGERGRNNAWAVTASAFTVGAVLGGVALTLTAALIGALLPTLRQSFVVLGVLLVAAGVLDLLGITTLGSHRQVNERWIDEFRGSIYGAGFGFQLGLGFVTYVVTWGMYVVLVAGLLSSSLTLDSWPLVAVVIGATFGLGRSIPVWAARWIDRPSRLSTFHKAMSDWGPRVRIGTAVIYILIGGPLLFGALA